MSAIEAHPVPTSEPRPTGPSTGVAELLVVEPPGCRVRLRDGRSVSARVALPGYAPRAGESVLVTVDDDGLAWVIGVVAARPSTPLLDDALEQASGVRRVHDKRGELLFEYDPSSDHAVLHVPSGDLELHVPEGALRMKARDGVELVSERDVSIRGRRTVTVTAEAGASASTLRLRPGELSLVASVVSAAADRAQLIAHAASVRALDLESHAERVRTVANIIDTRAGRIVERARDAYREIEQLSQTRAGKLRLVARGAAQLVGENTLLKARDRMKVKGERIHLA